MRSGASWSTCALVLLCSLTPLAAAAQGELGSQISPSELLEMIEEGRAPTIVDVRTGREFEKGHIPGAIHIPFWSVLGRASRVPTPHTEAIVIYCEHGPRARMAKLGFRMRGFDRVVYLEGHMTAWKGAGLPQEVAEPD